MKLRHLLAALLLLAAGGAMAQAPQMGQIPDIPVDTAVHMGKLANGLTYYVRYNNYPKGHVNFYIAQRVGSIQEEESQRGLAHFLEHMAFNGSDHFKDNGIIDYTRQLGVEFGRDLNAYTAVDQTVYRINDVPSTRQSALDSCLLILRDWSCGLTLDGKEIDKERGVIHEEWRMRSTAQQRMLNRALETLYPGSKYGKRMPIGLMSVVDNFKYKELRDYYKKWYHPTNQAIVVVGDVNVPYTIKKIEELFGTIKNPANAAPVVDEPVPDNAKPIIVVEKDKEQPYSIVQLMFKRDPTPVAERSKITYLLEQYAQWVTWKMFNDRLNEKALDPACPFKAAGCNDGEYIYAKTKNAFTVYALPKDGKTAEALKAIGEEVMRAKQHGFTATELARAQEEYLSQLESLYNTRDQIDNHTWGQDMVSNYLSNEPLASLDLLNKAMPQMTKMMPVEAINEYFGELISGNDSNVVVLNYNQEKAGAVYPTTAQLSSALETALAAKMEPYVDKVKNEPLIKQLPKPGKIVKETENTKLGYKELTLSNGATVILKKTDFKADEILMRAEQFGGLGKLSRDDYAKVGNLYTTILGQSGLGDFDNTELSKALAGKQASVRFATNNSYDILSGSSTVKDLPTLFQLLYLNMTNVTKDQKNIDNLMGQFESILKNKDLNPDYVYNDSVEYTFNARNFRSAPFGLKELKLMDYDRILQVAKEHTANAAGYTFYFVGAFEDDSIRPLIEQYIASLPSTGAKTAITDWAVHPKGQVINRFSRKMETPKAMSRMYWYSTAVPFSMENQVYAAVAGQLLDRQYLKVIREEKSAAYSPGAYGYTSTEGNRPISVVMGQCIMDPAKSDLCLKLMKELGEGLGKSADAAAVADIKSALLKDADKSARENNFWMGVLSTWKDKGVDIATTRKDVIGSVTAEKVSKWFTDVILKAGNMVEVTMTPEK